MADEHRIETEVVHAGTPSPRIGGAAVMPIFQSVVYEQADGAGYHDLIYPRLNNLPNHRALSRKLAVLEGAEDAVVTSGTTLSMFLMNIISPSSS